MPLLDYANKKTFIYNDVLQRCESPTTKRIIWAMNDLYFEMNGNWQSTETRDGEGELYDA